MDSHKEKEYLDKLAQGVVDMDDEGVRATSQAAVTEGLDPQKAIFEGLLAGMQEVGELYEKQEYFVPELLMCSDALYAGLDIFKPLIASDETEARATILMGVVEGDVHDIGKNIVKILFEASGFRVHDLGKDVPLDRFVEELSHTKAEIVAISAMMTTTMMQMRDIIKAVKTQNPDVKVIIGGAPVTEDIVKLFGADAYGRDASYGLKEVIRLIH